MVTVTTTIPRDRLEALAAAGQFPGVIRWPAITHAAVAEAPDGTLQGALLWSQETPDLVRVRNLLLRGSRRERVTTLARLVAAAFDAAWISGAQAATGWLRRDWPWYAEIRRLWVRAGAVQTGGVDGDEWWTVRFPVAIRGGEGASGTGAGDADTGFGGKGTPGGAPGVGPASPSGPATGGPSSNWGRDPDAIDTGEGTAQFTGSAQFGFNQGFGGRGTSQDFDTGDQTAQNTSQRAGAPAPAGWGERGLRGALAALTGSHPVMGPLSVIGGALIDQATGQPASVIDRNALSGFMGLIGGPMGVAGQTIGRGAQAAARAAGIEGPAMGAISQYDAQAGMPGGEGLPTGGGPGLPAGGLSSQALAQGLTVMDPGQLAQRVTAAQAKDALKELKMRMQLFDLAVRRQAQAQPTPRRDA
jgi:hypothetical protein